MQSKMHNGTIKVYITQEGTAYNYMPAEEFGDIVFLTRHEYSPIPSSLINPTIIQEIRSKLADYRPGVDWIAPSGSPVIAAIVFMVARERGSALRILHWSNQERCYRPIELDVAPHDDYEEFKERIMR